MADKEERGKAKNGRVKTGIPGLDELLGGGFKRNGIVTVTGDSGCGKTTFAFQFLVAGATQYNEPGVHISFEETMDMNFDNLKEYGWNLEKLEKEKKLAFYEYPPHEAERFVTQEALIYDMIEEIGAKRFVIDSISSLALLYPSAIERKERLVKLLEKLRKWNCTVLLTSEAIATAEGAPHARFGVENLSDGLVYLYNMRRGDTRLRALEVLKMRGIKFDQRICPLRFTEKGIAVYPREHVYENI